MPLDQVKYCRSNQSWYWKDGKTWAKCSSLSAILSMLHLEWVDSAGQSGVNRRDAEAVERAKARIEFQQYVDYVGELAGYPAGVHTLHGKGKMLCWRGFELPAADNKQPCTFIRQFLLDLLGHDQREYLECWLQTAYYAIKENTRRPLPVLCLIGPVESGKSLLLWLIAELLGNRVADAYKFLSTNSKFNKEVIGSELLVIDDHPVPCNGKARDNFGQAIKNQLFAPYVLLEGKGVDAMTVTPVQFVIVACNAENVKILPIIGADLVDKFSLLKVTKVNFNKLDKWEIQQNILSEISGYLAHLIWLKIPEKYHNARTITCAVQHPEMLALVNEDTPEARLAVILQADEGISNDVRRNGKHVALGAGALRRYLLDPETETDEYHKEWLAKMSPEMVGRILHKLSPMTSFPYDIRFELPNKGVRRMVFTLKATVHFSTVDGFSL